LLLSDINGLREKAANVVAIAAFNKEFEFLKILSRPALMLIHRLFQLMISQFR
jgi:hypothetical protein